MKRKEQRQKIRERGFFWGESSKIQENFHNRNHFGQQKTLTPCFYMFQKWLWAHLISGTHMLVYRTIPTNLFLIEAAESQTKEYSKALPSAIHYYTEVKIRFPVNSSTGFLTCGAAKVLVLLWLASVHDHSCTLGPILTCGTKLALC